MGAFAALKSYRFWAPRSVEGFLSTVRLLPFLLQAGQAVKTLTGYGIVLGGIMALVTDAGWSLVQAARGGSVRVEGPPPSDILGKATRYLLQPAYHAIFGQLFTFEEHMLLAAADSVAVQQVLLNYTPGLLDSRWPVMEAAPVLEFQPWTPESISGAAGIGWKPGTVYRPPLEGLGPGATYGAVLQAIAAGHEQWWETIASEFPQNIAANEFTQMVSETGRAVLEWMLNSPGSIKPVFTAEEIALARMFESGVFPVDHFYPELLEEYTQRAVELAQATGREFPQRGDIIQAIDETFGGHVER